MPSSSPKSIFHARPSTPSSFSLFSSSSSSRKSSSSFFFIIIIFLFFSLFLLFSLLKPTALHNCPNPNPKSVRVLWDHDASASSSNAAALSNNINRHKVMGFVGIFTGFGSVGRRVSLRKTWFPSDPNGLQRLEEATGLAFRFIIGRTSDRSKMSALQREVAQYDDFIQLDIQEEYSKLPYKTLAYFKAAYALFEADFYVKADDDIYLRPDRLSLLLAHERSHPQTYIGCMKKGPVFTDPKLKWYEPLSNLLGTEYFLHAYGPIYALSADVVSSLVALRNNSFRMFSNEDVTIGAWMLAMNVNHENNKELCAPDCTPTSIAVWDIPKCSGLCNPEKRMLELHQKESCTQSPTVESDE
ncbi:hypothetical protein RIF29_39006 [Crotalaria pallida]|uniref:Hexosyltransferase n=1 Tax=Crotalaria pallida TaxID=3830 RepID=A0AAN9HSW9_CROPI